jgi:hypothetical protein
MKFTAFLRSTLIVESVVLLSLAVWAVSSAAQSPVYRCKGNEYVASVKDSKNGDCKLMEGGNVTVVQGTRVNLPASEPVKVATVAPKSPSSSTSSGSGQRSESSSEQRSRDSDSRAILESELKKSEAKQAELLKEYNNGEPDRNALDIKNPQRYIDRIAELKANIARNDSDIAGIKRELGRNPGSTAKSN